MEKIQQANSNQDIVKEFTNMKQNRQTLLDLESRISEWHVF